MEIMNAAPPGKIGSLPGLPAPHLKPVFAFKAIPAYSRVFPAIPAYGAEIFSELPGPNLKFREHFRGVQPSPAPGNYPKRLIIKYLTN
jgi:hypothetical protein